MQTILKPPVDERDWTMTHRLIGLILGAGTGLLLGGPLVIAVDRIDLFDTNSNRAGYIIVDPRLNGSIRTTRNRIAPGGARSLRSPGPGPRRPHRALLAERPS